MRFQKWGQLVGLPSGQDPSEPTIPYNTQLDRPQVRPHIERALENIRLLLKRISDIDSKYGIHANATPEEAGSTLRGTAIFQSSFDRLKIKIRRNGKERSTLSATKWALHDGAKFKEGIAQLTAFVDALVEVTTILGLLEKRYEVLQIHEEINNITNEEDLELLAAASSKHSTTSIHQTVSDTASRRLLSVASIAESEGRNLRNSNTTFSTKTKSVARSFPSELPGNHQVSTALEPLGVENEKVLIGGDGSSKYSPLYRSTKKVFSRRPCARCNDTHIPCFTSENAAACFNCTTLKKKCGFDSDRGSSSADLLVATSSSLLEIPQHERVVAESAKRATKRPKPLTFHTGDGQHGLHLHSVKKADHDYWSSNAADMVAQAFSGTSATKRMFHELKIIREGHIPFISASPFADNLGKILASIEGPPETPYERGIFWIKVHVCQKEPPGPPSIYFHTKIYHPNIHPTSGALCADYQQKWNPAMLPNSIKGHFKESSALWSQRVSPDMWSLSALLIAICGLLASPNVMDPLVPEIAQKYLEDPEGYYQAAKSWTKQYAAITQKPEENEISFPEDDYSSADAANPSPTETSARSGQSRSVKFLDQVQTQLRAKYDEKRVGKAIPEYTVLHNTPDQKDTQQSTEKYLLGTFDPHGSEKHLRSIKDVLQQPARIILMEQHDQIYLFGQTFSIEFIGRRLCDWMARHYNRTSPAISKADELRKLTTQLTIKRRQADRVLRRLPSSQNRDIIDDFVASGGRLLDRFRSIFKMCEDPLTALGTDIDMAVGSRLGLFFAHAIFGSRSYVETIDKLLTSLQLWHRSFDNNCRGLMEGEPTIATIPTGVRSNDRYVGKLRSRGPVRNVHMGLSRLEPIAENEDLRGEDGQAICYEERTTRLDKGKGVVGVDTSLIAKDKSVHEEGNGNSVGITLLSEDSPGVQVMMDYARPRQ